jgi:hypothetical protein
VGVPREIFFLWRPFLCDPKDEMVLELAVKAGCEIIITYSTRNFAGVEQFGLKLLEPSEFLRLIGKLPRVLFEFKFLTNYRKVYLTLPIVMEFLSIGLSLLLDCYIINYQLTYSCQHF